MPKLQSSPCLAVYIAEALMGNLIAWHFTMVSTFSTQWFVSWIGHPKVCQILVLWTSGATVEAGQPCDNGIKNNLVLFRCPASTLYTYIYIYMPTLTMLMKWQYRSMAIESLLLIIAPECMIKHRIRIGGFNPAQWWKSQLEIIPFLGGIHDLD